jgi:hypothetical protein
MNKFVHVMPIDDVISHEGTPDCVCGPGGQIVSAVDLIEEADGWIHDEEPDDSPDYDLEDADRDAGDAGDWAVADEEPDTGEPRLPVCIIYHHYALRPCHEWEASPEL